MYLAFNEKVTFTDCLIKFINDNGEIKGNFSIALPLDNSELPKFSKEEHSLAEYDINNAEVKTPEYNVNHPDLAVDPMLTEEELIK